MLIKRLGDSERPSVVRELATTIIRRLKVEVEGQYLQNGKGLLSLLNKPRGVLQCDR